MPLSAPITRTEHSALRAAVIDFKEATPRGRAPVSLQVGVPGRAVARHVVERGQPLDQALRTDIVGRPPPADREPRTVIAGRG